jgi:hypothetical protein
MTEVSLEASALEQTQGLPCSEGSVAPITPPQSGQIKTVDMTKTRSSFHPST